MKVSQLLMALVLVAPGLVLAQQSATAPLAPLDEAAFKQLDSNGDGKISGAEYQAFMATAFDTLNTSQDGKLTRAQAAPVLTAEEFALLDTDGDGVVTREMFMRAVMKDFERQDRNGDGYLGR